MSEPVSMVSAEPNLHTVYVYMTYFDPAVFALLQRHADDREIELGQLLTDTLDSAIRSICAPFPVQKISGREFDFPPGLEPAPVWEIEK